MHPSDLSYRLFDAIALGAGVRALLVAGTVAAAVGLAILAWRRREGLAAWGLLGLGGAALWVGLLTVSERRIEAKLSPVMTLRYHAHGEAARQAAQLGLVIVPVLGWLGYRLRGQAERARRRSLFSTYLRIATKAYLDGDFDRAIAEYSIAIRVEPGRTDCLVKRGLVWVEKGQYARAIADFDRALKIDPDLASAYLNRGIVLAAGGDHDRAVADFDRATGLGPNDAAAVLHRGLSLVKLGEIARAADEFRRVLKITNHSDFVEPARFHLAMLADEPQSAEYATLG